MPKTTNKRKGAERLAILGGTPAFAEPLHVGRPNVGRQEKFVERVNGMFERRWFTNDGPLVREFEGKIAEHVKAKHCIAICNATVALEIAIRALDLRGEVIVPSFTFVATAHALQWQEITPVFADMDPATHNVDARQIERLITPRTTGIIGVHVWGRPCDTEAIAEIAGRRGLRVLYDAAHAMGCSHRGQMIGNFGACEVFSFHATKFVNSFEGGAIVTNDDALARKVRLMRNFGFEGYDRVGYIGTNGKLTEICAAMGLASLEAIEEMIAINRENYHAYRRCLAHIPGLKLIDYDSPDKRNFQYMVVEVDPAVSPLTRDEIVDVMHAENVLVRKYFWPGCHRMEPYKSLYPNAFVLLPETERSAARVIIFPTGQTVTPSTAEKICARLQRAFTDALHVKAHLKKAASVN